MTALMAQCSDSRQQLNHSLHARPLAAINERIRLTKQRIKACDDPNADEETIRQLYEGWAQEYETDVLNYGYRGYIIMMAVVQEFVTNKQARILVMCTGTGLDAQLLYQTGYHNLEGHDGSPQMLKIADRKNIFRRQYCEWLHPNTKCSLPSNCFDVLVCVGCVGPTHLQVEHMNELLKRLKKGGLLIVGLREVGNTKDHKNLEYKQLYKKLSPNTPTPTEPEFGCHSSKLTICVPLGMDFSNSMYVRPESGQYDLDAFLMNWTKHHVARCVARRTVPNYYPGTTGVFYVIKKLSC